MIPEWVKHIKALPIGKKILDRSSPNLILEHEVVTNPLTKIIEQYKLVLGAQWIISINTNGSLEEARRLLLSQVTKELYGEILSGLVGIEIALYEHDIDKAREIIRSIKEGIVG